MNNEYEVSKNKPVLRRPRVIFPKKVKHHFYALLFLAPILLSIGLIKYYPFITAVMKSFYEWNGANLNQFTGLQNYIALFKDPIFYLALKNVFIITVLYVVGQMVFPLLAAVSVFHVAQKRLQNTVKTLFIVPMVVPAIVVILTWRWLYMADYGVINEFLEVIGLGGLAHDWLGDPNTALGAVVFMNFPWVGTISFLILLAGLISISQELFECGKIDGLSPWKRLIYIELPLIRTQMRLVVILAFIHQFQSFENILVLTNGGPGYATITPALHLYQQGFSYNNLGYASAIGVVVFIILLTFTVLTNKLAKPTDQIH